MKQTLVYQVQMGITKRYNTLRKKVEVQEKILKLQEELKKIDKSLDEQNRHLYSIGRVGGETPNHKDVQKNKDLALEKKAIIESFGYQEFFPELYDLLEEDISRNPISLPLTKKLAQTETTQ